MALIDFLHNPSFLIRIQTTELKAPKQNWRFYNSVFFKFQAKSSLARHIQFLHEGKTKSKFRCTLCDMQFAHKETLRKHTETVCKHLFSSYFIHISFRNLSQGEKLSEIKPPLASVMDFLRWQNQFRFLEKSINHRKSL